jgi:hypothetical protein
MAHMTRALARQHGRKPSAILPGNDDAALRAGMVMAIRSHYSIGDGLGCFPPVADAIGFATKNDVHPQVEMTGIVGGTG